MHLKFLVPAYVTLALVLAPASARADEGSAGPIATFEGTQINLSQGWGDAQACLVANGAVECFRDRSKLLAREHVLSTQPRTARISTASTSCSSPLRLYEEPSYAGRELDFYDRGYWQNLSTWGFSNQLSSYKVGACGVYLADDADGGGSWYPGNTNAGHVQPSMLSGWNDRIGSIFIQ
ncbi:MAG: hypothetical protein QOF45_499 [Gaiellaceae bacterium]|jgi:hypothetical protein|nr:hypothetical protein [Gaiellaceae bacterium]